MSGRRVFGNVRQKPNGKWEARYRDSRGDIHYRYFVTKAEADGHLSLMRADMLRGDWLDPRLGKITVGEWAQTFMASKRDIRQRTRELYDSLLRCHILPSFGPWPLITVTAGDVEKWMAELRAKPRLSESTEAKVLRLFRQMMSMAVRHRRIPFNPCEQVSAPPEKVGEMLFLTPGQVADLTEAVASQHAQWRALVPLAAFGGLRWGESVGLPLRHVDPLRSRVRVQQQLHRDGRIDEPKTPQSRRWVKLPKWLSDEVAAACALREPSPDLEPLHADLVFLTRDGTALQYSSSWMRRVWHPCVREALPPELHRLRFHDLRHTAVAIALDSAARTGHPLNPKQLQERMGHSTIRMTLDRYGHLFDGHDDEMIAAMANPFADRSRSA